MGLGLGEILVILLAALIVVGPRRLPGLARTLGAGMRELRKGMRELQETIEGADDEKEPKVSRPSSDASADSPRPGREEPRDRDSDDSA